MPWFSSWAVDGDHSSQDSLQAEDLSSEVRETERSPIWRSSESRESFAVYQLFLLERVVCCATRETVGSIETPSPFRSPLGMGPKEREPSSCAPEVSTLKNQLMQKVVPLQMQAGQYVKNRLRHYQEHDQLLRLQSELWVPCPSFQGAPKQA
ncbi:uncharacterized protein [Triticum aestivum]|uniref:uncharacterized protein isoform X2 n=1 Tax=Triticum aestivum TaxID=4565 RepID=UPI001D018368|nr:uncharacterized protein LOC123123634 isoform X2 [Triticum aestivum]XP_044400114.1 uncharacterized protein LOC123123634 isoform X2 [Triticum aestivum]XP_044400115.1 uncharacterized protein LOC123123634 isoform X2 [Triticum aestivum]